jgi:hypothetical protein
MSVPIVRLLLYQLSPVMETGLTTLISRHPAVTYKHCFCNCDVGRMSYACHGFKSLSLSWAFSNNTNNCHVQSLLVIHWGSFGSFIFEPGHEGS